MGAPFSQKKRQPRQQFRFHNRIPKQPQTVVPTPVQQAAFSQTIQDCESDLMIRSDQQLEDDSGRDKAATEENPYENEDVINFKNNHLLHSFFGV